MHITFRYSQLVHSVWLLSKESSVQSIIHSLDIVAVVVGKHLGGKPRFCFILTEKWASILVDGQGVTFRKMIFSVKSGFQNRFPSLHFVFQAYLYKTSSFQQSHSKLCSHLERGEIKNFIESIFRGQFLSKKNCPEQRLLATFCCKMKIWEKFFCASRKKKMFSAAVHFWRPPREKALDLIWRSDGPSKIIRNFQNRDSPEKSQFSLMCRAR